MNLDIIWYVVLAAFVNILGGVFIFLKRKWSEKGVSSLLALSAGLLLSITILDLIPEVIEANTNSPIFILLGFILFFILQQDTSHTANQVRERESKTALKGTMLGLIVYTFLDGFSISAGFGLDFKLGLTIFVAIILHKLPDGFTVSSLVFSLTGDKKKGLIASIILGLSTLIGGIVGLTLTKLYLPNEGILSLILAVTGGILLYVGASDLLPSITKKRERFVSWFVVFGVLIYLLIDLIIGLL